MLNHANITLQSNALILFVMEIPLQLAQSPGTATTSVPKVSQDLRRLGLRHTAGSLLLDL